MTLCEPCFSSVREDYWGSEYAPLCGACLGVLEDGVREGRILPNDKADKSPCVVCRRVCWYMRVGGGRAMCWECHGWWKRCARDDRYVDASRRLIHRLDALGLGHMLAGPARRLLTREE